MAAAHVRGSASACRRVVRQSGLWDKEGKSVSEERMELVVEKLNFGRILGKELCNWIVCCSKNRVEDPRNLSVLINIMLFRLQGFTQRMGRGGR